MTTTAMTVGHHFQVYISYGPKSNADLLLLYGFSLDRNPYNSVDVTISLDEVR